MHIIFKSVLMLSTKKISKVVHACQLQLAKVGAFFETQCSFSFSLAKYHCVTLQLCAELISTGDNRQ